MANLMLSAMGASLNSNAPLSLNAREGISLAKKRGAYHPERAVELVQRAGSGAYKPGGQKIL